jgi:glycosyltransferase involved in cell wall biosynthesis
MTGPLVSVVIGNYNYARFVGAAIDSALVQTHPAVEVVVVDDGSTDDSQAVITRYGGRVTLVFKANGGMGSTYNAGLPRTRGDVVIFLDSDDVLLPTAAAEAAEALREPGVAKAHWPLDEIDEHGERTGGIYPAQPLPEGDFREATLAVGPDSYLSPPTSGNAWSRRFLEAVLPLPEPEYRQHADTYLTTLAPLFGTVRRVIGPRAFYRVHGCNDYASRPAAEKNQRNLEIYDRRCAALAAQFAHQGVHIDPAIWKERNAYHPWMRRLAVAADELAAAIPPGSTVILMDDGRWADRWGDGAFIEGWRCVPFVERDGRYWGPPADDEAAIREFERLREKGAGFAVFGWPAFWWLDHYAGFHRYLLASYGRLLANDRVVIFDLRR